MFEGIGVLLRAPWFPISGKSADVHAAELRNELGTEHPLFLRREKLVVIAKCGANDDVLVADPSSPEQLFCVHLTWAHHPEPKGFPEFKAIDRDDLEDFFLKYCGR